MKSNWQTKKLSDVCDFQNGFAFKSNLYKSNGLPILRITNIQNDFIKANDIVYFDYNDYRENFEKYKVFKNDLVIAMSGATTGKLGINTTETIFYLNQRVGKFLPKKGLLKDFLYHYLSTKIEENLRISAGAAQPNLSTEQIKNFSIPFPPLPEQKRIVAILDKVFVAITKAKENAEKNLQNARELFESYLQNIFANPGDGWEKKKLGEIANIEYGFTDKAKDIGDYRYIRITDIDKNGNLKKENKVFIDFSEETKKFLLKDGDLLMARTGATYAKVLLYENVEKSIFASYLIRINFKVNFINKLYWYFSKSRIYWDQANKLFSGSAQPQFNGGALKELIFCFPKSFHDQKSIVTKLDTLSAETKKLETIYKQKLADLEELKKSILQKAFNGEL